MKRLCNWLINVFRVWRREIYLVFNDAGVMLFFFALPTLYPIVYTLIYNPEIVTKLPVAVVDNCRSAESRELVRMIDAAQSMDVAGYASDLGEARSWMNDHRVYGVFEIPSDYSQCRNTGEQAVVSFFCDMSLLLRYRTFLMTLTDLQMETSTEILTRKLDQAGLVTQPMTAEGDLSSIRTEPIMLGDPTQGFASFVIPGILVLILQQSLILGVAMLAAGGAERRRRNHGFDPLAVDATPGAALFGKMLCYVMLYLPMLLYTLHVVPEMFSLPHVGNVADYVLFMLPLLIASSFLGLTISFFVTERESAMPVIVFSSVIFLFLSGLTWPRYAMNPVWTMVGNLVPGVWGVEGFVRMNSNGSTLAEQHHPYMMLWVLSLFYFVTAYIVMWVRPIRRGE